MSALLVDDLYVPVPTRPQPGRWKHVDGSPTARPQVSALPGGRPLGVAAPQVRRLAAARPVAAPATAASGWQLTERGIAVVVIFFLAVVATAAAVLITSFLAVSNAPVGDAGLHQAPPVAAAVTRG